MYFQTCRVHVHYFVVHVMTFVGLLVFCSFSCFNPSADIKVKHRKKTWNGLIICIINYMHATIFEMFKVKSKRFQNFCLVLEPLRRQS